MFCQLLRSCQVYRKEHLSHVLPNMVYESSFRLIRNFSQQDCRVVQQDLDLLATGVVARPTRAFTDALLPALSDRRRSGSPSSTFPTFQTTQSQYRQRPRVINEKRCLMIKVRVVPVEPKHPYSPKTRLIDFPRRSPPAVTNFSV